MIIHLSLHSFWSKPFKSQFYANAKYFERSLPYTNSSQKFSVIPQVFQIAFHKFIGHKYYLILEQIHIF